MNVVKRQMIKTIQLPSVNELLGFQDNWVVLKGQRVFSKRLQR